MKIKIILIGLFAAFLLLPGAVATANGACSSTGVGSLTAHYINEVPADPLYVTCDIGVFFDVDGAIDGVEIHGTVAGAKPVQYGIYVQGANVDVTNSSVAVEVGYGHQFVAVTYRAGATGTISGNNLTGPHRVGILLRGSGTSVVVDSNEIIGTGPKSTGWAENGIQIDQGATATVKKNLIADHWWDKDNFVSTGLLIQTDGVTAHQNNLHNNDLGAYLIGNDNNFIQNMVGITYEEVVIEDIYGVFVWGNGNGVRQSTITSNTGTGLGLGVMGTGNKLIRNTVSGWDEDVWDGGDDTVWPAPFR